LEFKPDHLRPTMALSGRRLAVQEPAQEEGRALMMDAPVKKPQLRVAPLARDTLHERAYRRICDLILDGEISPGQVVTIQSLAEAFGVSTMPVREALKRLITAGAISLVTGRSMGIPRLSLERLADLRRVRLSVEGIATEWATELMEPSDLARLRQQCALLSRAAKDENVKDYLRANRAFHFIIYDAARSPTLFALIETLWLQIGPYLNLLRGSGNYVASNATHQAIVDALTAGDGKAAVKALRADINDAYAILSKMLR
jgi:DNA-binding GntR family transcriptional regulator